MLAQEERALLYGTNAQPWLGRPSLQARVGISVLLFTVLHALESAVSALAYFMLAALSDMHEAMLYSLSAMTAYGHETFHLT